MKNENCDKVISQNITINSILYVSTSMHYDDRKNNSGWRVVLAAYNYSKLGTNGFVCEYHSEHQSSLCH